MGFPSIKELLGLGESEKELKKELRNGKANKFHRKVNRDQEKVFTYTCNQCGHRIWRRYGERWRGNFGECTRCGLGRYKKDT
jgi:predicted RNA-binding Zn-ribbon protein involved in translation (DUF1610 family)